MYVPSVTACPAPIPVSLPALPSYCRPAPFACPVCGGRGQVVTTPFGVRVPCRCCAGAGVIWK